MKFSEIVDHLGKRGFVTRKQWQGHSWGWTAMFFGIDNISWLTCSDRRNLQRWSPNLSEMKANDWEILPMYWDSPKDDYKPFGDKFQLPLKGYTMKEIMESGAEIQRKLDAGEITLKDILPDMTDEQRSYCSMRGGILSIGTPLYTTKDP